MNTMLLAAVLGVVTPGAARDEPLAVGSPAPSVIALDQDGTSVDLGQLYPKGLVLVYFYPKADTAGCTAQACSLRDDYEALTRRGVRVIGVSTDDVAAQKAFKDKYMLPFTLLADQERKVIEAFGVPTNPGGRASRQAFLIKDGVVVWRDLKASTKEQAADVLAALGKLGAPGGT